MLFVLLVAVSLVSHLLSVLFVILLVRPGSFSLSFFIFEENSGWGVCPCQG